MDVSNLKAIVQRSLKNYLGTYQFAANLSAPAICLLPDSDCGYNYPPAGTETSKIEAKIFRPLNAISPLMGNNPMIPATWEIRLLQWAQNDSLLDAANLLVPILSRELDCQVGSPKLIPADEKKGIPEQVVIRFTQYLLFSDE